MGAVVMYDYAENADEEEAQIVKTFEGRMKAPAFDTPSLRYLAMGSRNWVAK